MRIETFSLSSVSKANELKKLSFRAYKGEILGIVGFNDSGIYPLIDIISGAGTISAGKIFIDEKPVVLNSLAGAQKNGIYFIDSTPMLVSNFSIYENICVRKFKPLQWVRAEEMIKETQRILDAYDVRIDALKKAGDLPPGEKKIIEILRVVANGAKVIVIDDSVIRLDVEDTFPLGTLLKKIAKEGVTIILAGVSYESIMKYADRMIALRAGRIEGIFYPEYDRQTIHDALTETEYDVVPVKKSEAGTPVAFRLRDICIPRHRIVNGNFFVREGEAVAFVNKEKECLSAVIDMMNGKGNYSGDMWIGGRWMPVGKGEKNAGNGIGYMSRHDKEEMMFENLTLGENVLLLKYPEYSRAGFLDKKMCRFAIKEFVTLYKLPPQIFNYYPDQLSSQIRVLVSTIKWLAVRPKVMLMEDPFANTDVNIKNNIIEFINYLKERGVGIIFSSPITREVHNICDRIYEIDGAEIKARPVEKQSPSANLVHFYSKSTKDQIQ